MFRNYRWLRANNHCPAKTNYQCAEKVSELAANRTERSYLRRLLRLLFVTIQLDFHRAVVHARGRVLLSALMKKWRYDSSRDLERTPLERLRRFPRQPDIMVYGLRCVAALIIRGLLRIYNRFEIIGHENLRTNRSLVMVANHCSHLDTLCLLAALPLRKLHRAFPAAASDYFFKTVSRLWTAAVVVNALPFAREVRVRESLLLCEELLATPGTILIIFPEGTRSTTGELREFKSGIGALVAGRDIPVVPCFIDGGFRAWPKGRRFPRPRKVRLIVGEPRNHKGRARDKIEFCAIAAELREAVNQLRQRNGSN